MRKIINGRRYDTETAKMLASWDNNLGRRDFAYTEETLYRKNTGEYFLYGWGGPASRYAQSAGLNSWGSGERIMPMTLEEAQKWSEDHLDGEEYEEIFGVVEEDGDKRTVSFSLSEATIEKIARIAQERHITKSAVIEELLK